MGDLVGDKELDRLPVGRQTDSNGSHGYVIKVANFQDGWHLPYPPNGLLSPTSRSAAAGLAHPSQGKVMKRYSSGPIHHPASFKMTSPKLGEEPSTETLEPQPSERDWSCWLSESPLLCRGSCSLHVCYIHVLRVRLTPTTALLRLSSLSAGCEISRQLPVALQVFSCLLIL